MTDTLKMAREALSKISNEAAVFGGGFGGWIADEANAAIAAIDAQAPQAAPVGQGLHWEQMEERIHEEIMGPPEQAAPAQVCLRETLTEAISEGLRNTYHCTRVWSAWSVGTMSQDDFEPVGESDTPADLAETVLAALAVHTLALHTAQAAPVALTDERLREMAAEAETPAWGEWYSDDDALLRFARAVLAAGAAAQGAKVPAVQAQSGEQTNLACKSVQKRLATQRGYVQALTPLTDEQMAAVLAQMNTALTGVKGWRWLDFARAIERAHGIGAAAQGGEHG